MKFPNFKLKSSDIIKIDSLIGKRAVVDGNITGKGNYKIDGTVTGDIKIKGDLVTGEKSVITGEIVAKNIIIAGKVTGDVTASGQLTIKHTGVITGDQKCGSLIIEEGSNVVGKCEINGNDQEENNTPEKNDTNFNEKETDE